MGTESSDARGRGQAEAQAIKWWPSFFGGIVVGIILAALIGWLMMPKMMLVTHQSRYNSVDETCNRLKMAIESHGWQCPAVRNMNQAMRKHGVEFSSPVRIVELCNAKYAKAVLETNPEVSTLMPCAWGVYKGRDGKVYITGMNMSMMAKMFGGNIARIMGGAVAADEAGMLDEVIKK